MSEVQSPSPSPSRPLVRPDWPSSPAFLRYNHRSSQSSVNLPGANPGLSAGSQWAYATSNTNSSVSAGTSFTIQPTRQNTGGGGYMSASDDSPNTNHWNFMGFEWYVPNVEKLREFVETEPVEEDAVNSVTVEAQSAFVDKEDNPAEAFEVLKHTPMLADNKFKLEIARSSASQSGTNQSKTLSLYITSFLLDFAPPDSEISASIMAAIKCHDKAGERTSRPEWVWEHWQNEFVFRQENEVWESELPLLSELLKNPRIKETDSFVVCIQIHAPIGPFFPSQPMAYNVPRDLLEGLEASLDNPNTGDVRFICLERLNQPDNQASPAQSPAASPIVSQHRSPSVSSSHHSSYLTARKRVIYAHSDILTRRSEYFATMLGSSFAEKATRLVGERDMYTVVVEEADFETIYWLLKYCYANWLLFKDEDDVRAAVDGVGLGWSAKWLNAAGNEWDWMTFQKVVHHAPNSAADDGHGGDTRSVTSAESSRSVSADDLRSPVASRHLLNQDTESTFTANKSQSPRTKTVQSKAANNLLSPTNRGVPLTTSRRPGQTTPALGSNVRKQAPGPLSVPPPARYSLPVAPTTQQQPRPRQTSHPLSSSRVVTPDPHPHPTPHPPPASAMSMYQIAHRYSMPALTSLALEHMMSTLTPQSSFPLLLASATWEELHGLVEDYVVDKWDDVSVSEEFEVCCNEVAAGEWGPEGGKTLMALFRRLRAPHMVAMSR